MRRVRIGIYWLPPERRLYGFATKALDSYTLQEDNTMPRILTVDQMEDEIIGTEVAPKLARKLDALLDEFPYVTTLLLGIENWFKINGDEKGARIVEQATLKLARHEAETA